MANQENNPTKKSKLGVVGVLSIAVAILFVLLLVVIAYTQDNPKKSTDKNITQKTSTNQNIPQKPPTDNNIAQNTNTEKPPSTPRQDTSKVSNVQKDTKESPSGGSNRNNNTGVTYKDNASQNINWVDYFPINRSSGKLKYLKFRGREIELFKPSTEYKGKQIIQNKEYYLTEASDGTQYLWEISDGLIYNKYIRDKDNKEFVENKYSGMFFMSMSGLQRFGEYKIELNKMVNLNGYSYICELLPQHELPNGLVFNNVLVQKYTHTNSGNYYTEIYFAKGIGIIHYRYAKIDVDNDGRKRKNFSAGFYLESHNLDV